MAMSMAMAVVVAVALVGCSMEEATETVKKELSEAEPYFVTSQILAFDEKRIHQFMRMYHADKHYLAATAEWMNLHVDLQQRRVAPWPAEIREQISGFVREQGEVKWPAEAGRRMSVTKPLYSAKA